MSSVFSAKFGEYLRSQLDEVSELEDIDELDDSWVVAPDDIKGYEAWLPADTADYTMHTFANVDRIDDNAIRLTNDDVTGESNDERIKRLVKRMMSRDSNAFEYRFASFIPYQFTAQGYCGKIIFSEDDDLQTCPIVPSPTPAQGATCTRCNLHNEYAPPSVSYICYECR